MGLQFTPAIKSIRRLGQDDVFAIRSDRKAALNIKQATVLHTCDSGLITETLTAMIPAGAVVLGVVARVVTALSGTGLTSWSLGETGATTRYGTVLALAVGTVADSTTWVAEPTGTWAATARNILLTGNAGGVFEAGTVRVTLFYRDFSAPLS